MKTIQTITMKAAINPWSGLKRVARVMAAAVSWIFLMLTTLLTGYFSGWVLFTIIRLGSTQTGELPILLILGAIAAGLAWLVARFFASRRLVGRVILIALALMLGGEAVWTLAYPDQARFWARQLSWGDSTLVDYERFPERPISNAAPAFFFKQNLSPELFQSVEYRSQGELKQMSLEDFLQSTHTTSFIVIQEDAILYEGYFNEFQRESIVTSFSVAKSFTSALIGIAIDEGYIGSVGDHMITYLPELKGKGLDEVTIRDLLLMSAGISYLTDEEVSPLAQITQFTDSGLTYAYPDLRYLALHVKPDGKEPGTEFNYNNYHPLLLGMILERTTGRPVAEYLQEKIWKPLGMEYPASWSMDSEESGFEQMQSGINARAIDFAKFGRLFLNNGTWEGAQVISEKWVTESTAPDPDDHRVWRSDADWKEANGYYKYQWWGRNNPDGSYDYVALGHLGQFIFVSPQEKMIIVRFGLDEGGVDSWVDVFQSLVTKAKQPVDESFLPVAGLTASTPEEQGIDSARLAEGLLAIQKQGTRIHSLMVVRNDSVVLDAYFYPYDGSIYHDLASVTKSVVTTLIGIAANQGKLKLDDPMLSFFPDRKIANRDDRKERITVRHLVSMGAGLECDRMDDEITLNEMRSSEDWVQFALDRRVVQEPGTRFVYCGLQMHLLSAILQKATGMTALEYARENLFGPLGIQDVYWPADPQGVTHGWGDLALRPGDMARLGSLFLHEGQWGGQQIVSRQWVNSAVAAHMNGTGKIEEYGYGWWVSPESEELAYFLASGGGGQKIRVVPSLNLILVTTGAGVEPSEVEPYLVAAMVDLEKPLPPNPGGVASLNTALAAIAKGPAPEPVPALPAVASAISGKTYHFGSEGESALGLLSLRLDFDDSAEAIFQLEMANEPGPRVIGVGLDGVYRASRAGRPIVARGSWMDSQTFVIDYNEGPGIAAYAIHLRFDDNRVTFEIAGLGSYEAQQE